METSYESTEGHPTYEFEGETDQETITTTTVATEEVVLKKSTVDDESLSMEKRSVLLVSGVKGGGSVRGVVSSSVMSLTAMAGTGSTLM
ncbi:unnamed protein product [Mortierella alpina]